METFTNAFNYMADDSGCISQQDLIVLMNSICDPGPGEVELYEILKSLDSSIDYDTIELNVFLAIISYWLSE